MPSINVNLKPCVCFGNYANIGAVSATAQHVKHDEPCREGSPVFIPCLIPPSVTFTVVLEKCDCLWGQEGRKHDERCPARPSRVSGSISGKTWEESVVLDACIRHPTGAEEYGPVAQRIAGERWELVKALVLGQAWWVGSNGPQTLFEQRDSVYVALADMVRSEASTLAAQERMVNLLDPKRVTFRPTNEATRPSAQALGLYVEQVLEQVGIVMDCRWPEGGL